MLSQHGGQAFSWPAKYEHASGHTYACYGVHSSKSQQLATSQILTRTEMITVLKNRNAAVKGPYSSASCYVQFKLNEHPMIRCYHQCKLAPQHVLYTRLKVTFDPMSGASNMELASFLDSHMNGMRFICRKVWSHSIIP